MWCLTFQVRFTQIEVRDALGELIDIAYIVSMFEWSW